MVAKINIGKSLYGAMAYNTKKVDNNVARFFYGSENVPVIFDENDNLQISPIFKAFNFYLDQNNRTQNPIVHLSLNPNIDDNLDDEQFKEIAIEYMDKLGFGKQPYVIFEHTDIDRKHFHIVTVNVDENGKKINDSFLFQKSKSISRELEKKYNLKITDSKKEKVDTLINLDSEKDNTKSILNNNLLTIVDKYHFKTIGEYTALLAFYNISLKWVKGVNSKEEEFNGFIYQALNKNGVPKGIPFKASLLSDRLHYKNIIKLCESNERSFKNRDTSKLKKIIDLALQKASFDKDKFITNLKNKNIDVFLKTSDKGRITGVTYIDHDSHTVCNGSNLGKQYSANSMDDYFNNKITIIPEEKVNINPSPINITLQSNTNNSSKTKTLGEQLMETLDNANYNRELEENLEKKKKKKKKPVMRL